MATVIDALVVTLGLDPKGVQKGQKEADTSFGKVKASAQSMGKGVDAAATSGAQAIRTMSREALSFFAVLTAGKSLKAFVQDNTRSNVALGNLSRNLGVSAQSLDGTGQRLGCRTVRPARAGCAVCRGQVVIWRWLHRLFCLRRGCQK